MAVLHTINHSVRLLRCFAVPLTYLFLHYFVCVSACRVCVHMCACVSVEAKGWWPCLPPLIPTLLLRQTLSLSLELANSTLLTCQWFLMSSISISSALELQPYTACLALYMVVGIRTQFLCFCGSRFTDRNTHTQPKMSDLHLRWNICVRTFSYFHHQILGTSSTLSLYSPTSN